MKVIQDVKQILKIPNCTLFRAPFNRKNLFYEVLPKSDVGKDAFNDLIHCIQHRFDKQSGRHLQKNIVYLCLFEKVLSIVYHKKMQKTFVRNYKEVVSRINNLLACREP
jgi:superfamily II DNA helicase RecQ